MIRLATLSLLLLAIGTSIVSAQQGDSTERGTYIEVIQLETSEPMYGPASMVTINPAEYYWMYNINYYHRVSNLIVIGGGVQVPARPALKGWGAQLDLRVHPSRMALEGGYLGASVSYNQLTVKALDVTGTAISVGFLGGWQWILGNRFAVGVGAGYEHYIISTDEGIPESAFEPFDSGLPNLRLDLGYAF